MQWENPSKWMLCRACLIEFWLMVAMLFQWETEKNESNEKPQPDKRRLSWPSFIHSISHTHTVAWNRYSQLFFVHQFKSTIQLWMISKRGLSLALCYPLATFRMATAADGTENERNANNRTLIELNSLNEISSIEIFSICPICDWKLDLFRRMREAPRHVYPSILSHVI